MAMLDFALEMLNGKIIKAENVISFELSKDIDAPCDGLRLTFAHSKQLDEICKVTAYENGKLIFNGNVDTQRQVLNENGIECFVYARSSACVLLDNEAQPCCYSTPSTQSLFVKNAGGFGFKSGLPSYYVNANYIVNKGTSCYGAINEFIKSLTGKNVAVNAENELFVPTGSNAININNYKVISEKRCINRGNLISKIDYKAEGDNEYYHHTKSKALEKSGISCSKKVNLASFPEWQRQNAVKNTIQSAGDSYYQISLVIDGCFSFDLYDKLSGASALGDFDGYYLTGLCVSLNDKGETTRLTMCKEYNLEGITYVD